MSRRDRESGAALVEMALVLPVFVALVFGLFDAGRAVIAYSELTNAARVGARVAMVNQSNDSTCTSGERTFKCAAAELTNAAPLDPATIDDLVITGSDCALLGGCSATVRVSHTFVPVTPLIGDLLGPIDLEAESTMAIEREYVNP